MCPVIYKLTSVIDNVETFHGVFSTQEKGKEAARKVWKKITGKVPFDESKDTYWCKGFYDVLSLSICIVDELE